MEPFMPMLGSPRLRLPCRLARDREPALPSRPLLTIHDRLGHSYWSNTLNDTERAAAVRYFAELHLPVDSIMYLDFMAAADDAAHASIALAHYRQVMVGINPGDATGATGATGAGAQESLLDAVERGSIEDAMLATGARPAHQDGMGTSLLMVAQREGHAHMVQWLLKVGADSEARDVFGETYHNYGHAWV